MHRSALLPVSALIVWLTVTIAPASAAGRVALVIGNSAYAHASELKNPRNDAEDMAALFERLGFTVIKGLDLTKAEMDRTVARFAGALQSAKFGVFFFAGHGVQVDGQNYLVPVDARLDTAYALNFEAVRLRAIQQIMEVSTKANAIFLDACRNNPFTRSLARALGNRSIVKRGLAQPRFGAGTFISFATQPDDVASDGQGQRNSPYTTALKRHLPTPGFELPSLLIRARRDVIEATGGDQIPWDQSALTEPMFLAGRRNGLTRERAEPPQQPDKTARPPLSEAATVWDQIKALTDVAVLTAFAEQYAGTVQALLADRRVRELGGERVAVGTFPEPAPELAERPAPVEVPPPSKAPFKACDGIGVSLASGGTVCRKPGAGESFRDCDTCPEMVVVPAGSFMMGSPESEEGREDDEGPQRRVTIGRAFAVGKFEVTWDEWEACVANGGCDNGPVENAGGDNGWGRGRRPVIEVSWNDAQAYVRWMSGKTGQSYRLLSEAEWEYAARAGTTTRFHFGNSGSGLAQHAWYRSNANSRTHPVGGKVANAWGLHDVYGNVWEWVADCYLDSYAVVPTDGSAQTTEQCSFRVLRGGSWVYFPQYLRSANRSWGWPGVRVNNNGFRVARTLNP